MERLENDFVRLEQRCRSMLQNSLLKICSPCMRDCIIVLMQNDIVPQCMGLGCLRTICKQCYERGLYPFCNRPVGLVSHGQDIDWDSLLLPCSNFDKTSTSPAETCRQLIPSRSYYNHIKRMYHDHCACTTGKQKNNEDN